MDPNKPNVPSPTAVVIDQVDFTVESATVRVQRPRVMMVPTVNVLHYRRVEPPGVQAQGIQAPLQQFQPNQPNQYPQMMTMVPNQHVSAGMTPTATPMVPITEQQFVMYPNTRALPNQQVHEAPGQSQVNPNLVPSPETLKQIQAPPGVTYGTSQTYPPPVDLKFQTEFSNSKPQASEQAKLLAMTQQVQRLTEQLATLQRKPQNEASQVSAKNEPKVSTADHESRTESKAEDELEKLKQKLDSLLKQKLQQQQQTTLNVDPGQAQVPLVPKPKSVPLDQEPLTAPKPTSPSKVSKLAQSIPESNKVVRLTKPKAQDSVPKLTEDKVKAILKVSKPVKPKTPIAAMGQEKPLSPKKVKPAPAEKPKQPQDKVDTKDDAVMHLFNHEKPKDLMALETLTPKKDPSTAVGGSAKKEGSPTSPKGQLKESKGTKGATVQPKEAKAPARKPPQASQKPSKKDDKKDDQKDDKNKKK